MPKLINDLNEYTYQADHRGWLEIQRADKSVTENIRLDSETFIKEQGIYSEEVDEEAGEYSVTVTAIPVVWKTTNGSEHIKYLVTITVTAKDETEGYVNINLPEHYRPTFAAEGGVAGFQQGSYTYILVKIDGYIFFKNAHDSWRSISVIYQTTYPPDL